MLQWFIIVVMHTANPATEGQPIFMFNNAFETKQACLSELYKNSNTYFLKSSLAFGGIPPKLANCVDTTIVDDLKSMDTIKKKETSTWQLV